MEKPVAAEGAAECTGLGGNSADETGAKRHVQGRRCLAYGVPRAEQVSHERDDDPPALAWGKPSISKRRMVE